MPRGRNQPCFVVSCFLLVTASESWFFFQSYSLTLSFRGGLWIFLVVMGGTCWFIELKNMILRAKRIMILELRNNCLVEENYRHRIMILDFLFSLKFRIFSLTGTVSRWWKPASCLAPACKDNVELLCTLLAFATLQRRLRYVLLLLSWHF